MKYFVRDCDCREDGVLPGPLNLNSSEDNEMRRVTVSLDLGTLTCAHCGKLYKCVENESTSERQIREDREARISQDQDEMSEAYGCSPRLRRMQHRKKEGELD